MDPGTGRGVVIGLVVSLFSYVAGLFIGGLAFVVLLVLNVVMAAKLSCTAAPMLSDGEKRVVVTIQIIFVYISFFGVLTALYQLLTAPLTIFFLIMWIPFLYIPLHISLLCGEFVGRKLCGTQTMDATQAQTFEHGRIEDVV